MKNFYFTTIALLFLVIAQAQIVNIPDANFKAKLIALGVDTSGDGEIQNSEALAVYNLDVSSSYIASLEGIQSFTNLYYLECPDNQLNFLNVNGLNNLQDLICYNNNMYSLQTYSTNLRLLSCGNNNLTFLELNATPYLSELYCQTNQLTSLDLSQVPYLNGLNCSSNQLTSLNLSALTYLRDLACANNQINSLDISNFNLRSLDCSYNPLSNIDLSSQGALLTRLDCSGNQLLTLNLNGLTNLISLRFSSNQLTTINLNGIGTTLVELDCSNNQLPTLNMSNLTELIYFNCSKNQLPSLNLSGLIKITSLDCSFNQLPNLNLSSLLLLQTLNCSHNQLPNLILNNLIKLETINCSSNQISTLNLNGLNILRQLICPGNQISTLDATGLTRLNSLDCGYNLLISLFVKSTSINYYGFDFNGNPNIAYICADDDDLTLVQTRLNAYQYTNCNVNSYCSFNPGGVFYTIQGNSPIDFNNNGCDAADPKYPNLKYTISDGTNSGSLIANNSGNYNIPVQAGTHLMSPQLENPSYFNVSPSNVSVTFPATASPFIQDFCITPNGVHHDLEVVIIPVDIARPGFDATYKIKYKNKGNQPENAILNFNFDDAILDYVSSSTVPTSQATGNLLWSIGTLLPFANGEIIVTLNLNSPMETPPVNSGNVLSYTANYNGLNNDDTIADNTFNLSQNVVNSYDPNDKNCLEGNTINPAMIGEYVHYMIRFENTGTFAAQNVVVKDIIDTTKFEISTLQMTEASHSCVTKISDVNKVEFIFENINLPFDNATNDGYVVFKIKTKSNLVVGNTISNSANIYFDYNFPIVTNTATSTFQTPLQNDSFVFDNYFSIYPNPANDVLNITSKLASEIYSLSIYNVLGQLVQTKTRPTKTVDVSGLKTGNYILKVNTENGVSSSKFTKL